MFYKKNALRKFQKNHKKTPVLESLFDKVRRCRSVISFKAQVLFVNFAKFVSTPFLQKTTRRILLIIAVSKIVKGDLSNETVTYDIEIKIYQFEPAV